MTKMRKNPKKTLFVDICVYIGVFIKIVALVKLKLNLCDDFNNVN